MKRCPSCSEKNPDTVSFCVNCGADLRSVAVTPDGWSAVAGDMPQKAPDRTGRHAERSKASVAAGGWDAATDATYRSSPGGAPAQKGGDILVDPGETVVAAIGSSYLQSFLSGGRVSKGVGVLTEKRF